MPPAGWVLLNRCVDYIFDDDEDNNNNDDPSAAAAADAEAVQRAWGAKAAASIAPIHYPTVAMLTTMRPGAAVAALPEPPEIATFTLRVSKSSQYHRGLLLSSTPLVACADKGLLVLYAGSYFGPGSSLSSCGCYLIHDAADDPSAPSLLSKVPPLPPETLNDDHTDSIGSGAVVLRCRPSSSAAAACCCLLAELATMPRRRFPDPDAALLLWRSDEQHPAWVKKEVHLPREVRRTPGDGKHVFQSDTAFAVPGPGPGGGCLCWVDQLRGIVVCAAAGDDDDDPHPALRFVPLPDGCPAFGVSDYPYRPRVEETRSAACVGGRIMVVAMVGDLEGWHAQ